MEVFALLIGWPYLAYLLVMAVFLLSAMLYLSSLSVWVAARWLVLTLLYYMLWPFAWLQRKLT